MPPEHLQAMAQCALDALGLSARNINQRRAVTAALEAYWQDKAAVVYTVPAIGLALEATGALVDPTPGECVRALREVILPLNYDPETDTGPFVGDELLDRLTEWAEESTPS